MSDFLMLVGRALLSAVFILYGYFKFMDVSGILNNPGTKKFMDLVAGGAAPPTWLGYLIAAIEVFGGLAILIGFKARAAAWGLLIWVILATYLAHLFWTMEGPARAANELNFFKNLAIMGGLLFIAAAGPGGASIDGRSEA
jgi:putative oxidoreductase